MANLKIRHVEPKDLPALLAIYNHYVIHTPVNFDIEPRTLEQRREWLTQFSPNGRYQCFVAIEKDEPVGYTCSMKFKEKAAYETTIETSIYCAPSKGGQGIGRRLYETLFDAIKSEDVHRAFGGITLPNEASVRVHERMGFRHIGTYGEVGRKFGKYWDVGLFLKDLG